MNKLSVAVCDRNHAYAESIGTWLFVEMGQAFSGSFFSTAKAFQEQYGRQRFQVVLLGKAFLQESWIQTEIKKEKNVLWLYLQEDGEKEPAGMEGKLPVIAKYEPLPMLVRSIYRYYEEYGGEETLIQGEKAELWGWYSPCQSIWQTPLALTMGSLLAEKEKVLYVSLKECSGFRKWFQEEYEQDLLDAMYFCQKPEKGAAGLGKFIYSIGNLEYIAPVQHGQLLCELTAEDYLGFVERLEQEVSYQMILLDMGSMFPGFFEVWKKCRKIYIPREENVLARGINDEFQQLVNQQEQEQIENKIAWLALPEWSREGMGTGCLMQQWLWGGPGDYVRELLSGSIGRD